MTKTKQKRYTNRPVYVPSPLSSKQLSRASVSILRSSRSNPFDLLVLPSLLADLSSVLCTFAIFSISLIVHGVGCSLLHVMSGNVPIRGSPFELKVIPGEVDSRGSKIEGGINAHVQVKYFLPHHMSYASSNSYFIFGMIKQQCNAGDSAEVGFILCDQVGNDVLSTGARMGLKSPRFGHEHYKIVQTLVDTASGETLSCIPSSYRFTVKPPSKYSQPESESESGSGSGSGGNASSSSVPTPSSRPSDSRTTGNTSAGWPGAPERTSSSMPPPSSSSSPSFEPAKWKVSVTLERAGDYRLHLAVKHISTRFCDNEDENGKGLEREILLAPVRITIHPNKAYRPKCQVGQIPGQVL